MLRMRRTFTDAERRERIKDIVIQLHLKKSMSTIIGRLSGGEKKRLAFASVLLTEPHVILIDEPTSGLDTYLAKSLMSIIRSIAVNQNHAVIVVLHQPTSSMFDMIDKLCLLVQGGRQAFFGTKEEAHNFFTSKCHLSATSLDGFIEQLAAPLNGDGRHDIAQEMVADQYAKSKEAHLLHAFIERRVKSNDKNTMVPINNGNRASFGRQLKWLLWRAFVADSRHLMRIIFIIVRLLIPAFFLGLIYFNLQLSNKFFNNVNSMLISTVSVVIIASALIVASAMPVNIHVCIKETGRGCYGVLAYYLATAVHDLPVFIIMPLLFGTITFWMPNMSTSWLHYFAFVAILILISNTGCALGKFISSFSSTIESAVGTVIPTIQTLLICSGFFLSLAHINPVFRIAQHLSPFYYGYSILFTLQWDIIGRNSTQQCDQLLKNNISKLYRNITSANIDCCTRPMNNDENFAVLRGHIYYNIGILFLLWAIWHIIAFAIIWYRAHRNRLNEYWLHIRKNKN
jgi:energy-coupling factor transporter ATP-binding protein EcfA2